MYAPSRLRNDIQKGGMVPHLGSDEFFPGKRSLRSVESSDENAGNPWVHEWLRKTVFNRLDLTLRLTLNRWQLVDETDPESLTNQNCYEIHWQKTERTERSQDWTPNYCSERSMVTHPNSNFESLHLVSPDLKRIRTRQGRKMLLTRLGRTQDHSILLAPVVTRCLRYLLQVDVNIPALNCSITEWKRALIQAKIMFWCKILLKYAKKMGNNAYSQCKCKTELNYL